MKNSLLAKTVLIVTTTFTLGIFFVNTVEGKSCSKTDLPRWLDWRTDQARNPKPRTSLLESPFKTALVVIGAVLIVLLNALLCHLLYSDKSIWGQRTYRMIFSLACNDCITGIFLGLGVLAEIESVHKVIGCKIVISGLWLCVVTSIYTFMVISLARWMMLNHPKFFTNNFEKKNPMRAAHIAIASCWIAGACHAIPLLTSWNNECVSDFTTCSLPYKSPLWIWGAAIFVLFIPSLVIVVVYTLILLKMRADNNQDLASQTVTKTMSLLTAAFLLCWWPLGIYLSVRWNSVGASRGIYAGTISSLVNPVLLIYLNNQLNAKVAAMFAKLKCCKT